MNAAYCSYYDLPKSWCGDPLDMFVQNCLHVSSTRQANAAPTASDVPASALRAASALPRTLHCCRFRAFLLLSAVEPSYYVSKTTGNEEFWQRVRVHQFAKRVLRS